MPFVQHLSKHTSQFPRIEGVRYFYMYLQDVGVSIIGEIRMFQSKFSLLFQADRICVISSSRTLHSKLEFSSFVHIISCSFISWCSLLYAISIIDTLTLLIFILLHFRECRYLEHVQNCLFSDMHCVEPNGDAHEFEILCNTRHTRLQAKQN